MHPLPHSYQLTTTSTPTSNLNCQVDNLPALSIAPPIGFDGPGDIWSPEDLLMASVSSCLILSFKAIARMSKFEWRDISCHVDGTLDKTDGGMRFTKIHTVANLTISNEADKEKAEKLLHKADNSCLVSNSLNAEFTFTANITVVS